MILALKSIEILQADCFFITIIYGTSETAFFNNLQTSKLNEL